MKRKPIVLLFAILMMTAACFALAACDDKTIEQLFTQSGIIVDGGGFEKGHVLNAETIDANSEKGVSVLMSIADQLYNTDKGVYILTFPY